MSTLPAELALDASVCINLVATDQFQAIIRALKRGRIVVVEQVAHEVIRNPFAGGAGSPIAGHAEDGTLRIVSLTDASAETWLSLVGASPPDDLDDGEAATIAFAHHHSLGAAIDERKGIRICGERFPSLRHVSTLDLLRHPSVGSALGRNALAEAVWSALHYARMRVPLEHETWVRDLVGAERLADCQSVRSRARDPAPPIARRPARRSRNG